MTMDEELIRLEYELDQVKNSPYEYLPQYGYSYKDEIIALIEEDIKKLKEERDNNVYDYDDYDLEEERIQLCLSQGLSRFC